MAGCTVAPPVVIRRACPADYAAYARLFPEMKTHDPAHALEVWLATIAPFSWMATDDSGVVGYCYCQEYADSGYVRNVVVAPNVRRAGVGRALMDATAAHLRSLGKCAWRLNVEPSNDAAIALYRAMGMHTRYRAKALRLPWASLGAVPPGSAQVRAVTVEREGSLEVLFRLPAGQLAEARRMRRVLLEGHELGDGATWGLAVFDPRFPGAFPFRVKELGAVAPLLRAMRGHVPTDDHVGLVVEDDERLASVLQTAGALLRFEMLRMEGTL